MFGGRAGRFAGGSGCIGISGGPVRTFGCCGHCRIWYLDLGWMCYNRIVMRLVRDITKLKKMGVEDDSFVDASPSERVGLVWELTRELWSLSGGENAEHRLQRDVGNLVKQRC